ncbi:hypothetical protein ACFQL8_24200 [Streptomyces goshikiensis]|uniref:hypothetical protein n=1 Tax=Streptomyces goshikiensis TaxID=1942 RepID=UPI00332149F5
MGGTERNARLLAAIAALTELTSVEPRVTRDATGTLVEADSALVPTARWQRLVDILETGTSYGMTTADTGRRPRVWLRFDHADTQ